MKVGKATLTVDGTDLPLDALTYDERKFGERSRRGAATEPYALCVDRADFATRFGPVYEQCVRELEQDDAVVGEFQPPFDGATRYPEFQEFFELAAGARMEMVRTWLRFDILGLYLAENDPTAPWLVQSVDAVSVGVDVVLIEGRASRLRQ
jgi:hypothetical protein